MTFGEAEADSRRTTWSTNTPSPWLSETMGRFYSIFIVITRWCCSLRYFTIFVCKCFKYNTPYSLFWPFDREFEGLITADGDSGGAISYGEHLSFLPVVTRTDYLCLFATHRYLLSFLFFSNSRWIWILGLLWIRHRRFLSAKRAALQNWIVG